MQGRPALEQAIHLLRTPAVARTMQANPLPSDIGFLLRVLARDPEAENMAVERSGRSIETIREAAEFYAAEIMFAPQASAYRALAAPPGASRDQLRAHMGLLLRWLHPDHRNTVEKHAWFDRVVHAWELLSSAERRADYDRRIAVAAVPARGPAISAASRAPFFATTRPARPARQPARRTGRRLMRLALLAIVLAGLVWIFVDRDSLEEHLDLDWLFGAARGRTVLAGAILIDSARPRRADQCCWRHA